MNSELGGNKDIFQRPPNPRPARIEKYPYFHLKLNNGV